MDSPSDKPRAGLRALASDYDGTLAHDGHVTDEILASIDRLRASGRKFILVTGRELPELRSVFPRLDICDAIVAENGGLLYWPAIGQEEVLAPSPPEALVAELHRRQVQPFSVGKCIFATWRPFESAVLEAIQMLGLEYQIIFNKRAVMVLPSGVNKATGLTRALAELEISPAETVGVGDAENDHAFLEACGLSAAVANAIPSVKERCDIALAGDHGVGVVELIDRVLAEQLPPPRTRPLPTQAAPEAIS